MRTPMSVASLMCVLALSASAQTKVSGKLSCGKPDVNSPAEVGDAAGHVVVLTKANCTWPTPLEIDGVKTKSAIDVGVADVRGASGSNHGYSTSVMENGDKASVSYQGMVKSNKDGSGTFEGTWKWISGTGKFKGIKGSGTFKGSQTADGVGTADINGEYTLASPPPAKKGEKKP